MSSYLIPAASRVSEEMSVVNMDTLSQDDLKKRVMALVSIDDWSDACLQCSRPSLLHKGGPCTRSEKEPSEKILEIWEEFRKRTKAVVTIVKAESYREERDGALLDGLKKVLVHLSSQSTENMEGLTNAFRATTTELVDSLTRKAGDVSRSTKLTKPAKVPNWTKDLTLEIYAKQIRAWNTASEDVPVNTRYHDLVESLKMNKDIHGLPRFVGDHVLPVLDKFPDQTVERVLELLETKYGRTRIEKMEECVKDWLEFKEDVFEEEDEFVFAMKELNQRKLDLEITDKEWFSVWMLGKAKKRKKLDSFEFQALRTIVKSGGDEVIDKFEKMYRELRVEGQRKKLKETLYMEAEKETKETLYMGTPSDARKRYQGDGYQRGSSFQGEGFQGRYDGDGRSRYDRPFVRDSSFVRRPDSRGREDFRRDRSRSRSQN